MIDDEELKKFIADRNAGLLALDIEWARIKMPAATSDEIRLGAMHKTRYECSHFSEDVRRESENWLRERGLGRATGGPLLPPGELPGRTD